MRPFQQQQNLREDVTRIMMHDVLHCRHTPTLVLRPEPQWEVHLFCGIYVDFFRHNLR